MAVRRLLHGTPHGHLMEGVRREREALQRNRAQARAAALRCMLCQSDFEPGERTTWLDGERVHVQCCLEYFDITSGDEAA